jgi:hypothetical protein
MSSVSGVARCAAERFGVVYLLDALTNRVDTPGSRFIFLMYFGR